MTSSISMDSNSVSRASLSNASILLSLKSSDDDTNTTATAVTPTAAKELVAVAVALGPTHSSSEDMQQMSNSKNNLIRIPQTNVPGISQLSLRRQSAELSLASASSTPNSAMTDISPLPLACSPSNQPNQSASRKKRNRNEANWKRHNYQRKELKDKGACNCTRKCFDRINLAERVLIRNSFAKLPKFKQDVYLLSLIAIDEKKTLDSGTKHKEEHMPGDHDNFPDADATSVGPEASDEVVKKRTPKQFNSKYFLLVDDKRIRVCHFAFLSIHGIGKKRVNNLVTYAFSKKETLPRDDRRGRHKNRANRVSEDLVSLAENHIKIFPRYAIQDLSIRDTDANLRTKLHADHTELEELKIGPPSYFRYLSPQLSIVRMYRLFVIEFQPILFYIDQKIPSLNKIDRARRRFEIRDAPSVSSTSSTSQIDKNLSSTISSSYTDFGEDFSLNDVFSLFKTCSCTTCKRAPALDGDEEKADFFPAFWLSSSTRSSFPYLRFLGDISLSTSSCEEKPTLSPADKLYEDFQPHTLLGLFCSRQCVLAFADRFITFISAEHIHSSIGIPYKSWKHIPTCTLVDKLFKPLVSRDKYERIFRSFNLRFGSGRLDYCQTCQAMEEKLKSFRSSSSVSAAFTNVLANEALHELARQFKLHQHRGKLSLEQLERDNAISALKSREFSTHIDKGSSSSFAEGTMDVIEVGFQSNRPLPQFDSSEVPDSEILYHRQLWIYLYAIRTSATQMIHTYLWDERTGKRKTNELLSVLWRHVNEKPSACTLSTGTAAAPFSSLLNSSVNTNHDEKETTYKRSPWLCIYGEGYQNFWSICFLMEICNPSSQFYRYRRIDYKPFDPGHTNLDTDRQLSAIDREGKLFPIFKPTDWIEAVKNVNIRRQNKSRLVPRWMSREYLFNWKSVLKALYSKTASLVDIHGDSVDLGSAAWFNFGTASNLLTSSGEPVNDVLHHPFEVWFRYSLDESEPWKQVRLRQVEHSAPIRPLSPLFSADHGYLPISNRKTGDLFDQRKHVPEQFRYCYPPVSQAQEDKRDDSSVDGENSTDVDEAFDVDDRFLDSLPGFQPFVFRETSKNGSLEPVPFYLPETLSSNEAAKISRPPSAQFVTTPSHRPMSSSSAAVNPSPLLPVVPHTDSSSSFLPLQSPSFPFAVPSNMTYSQPQLVMQSSSSTFNNNHSLRLLPQQQYQPFMAHGSNNSLLCSLPSSLPTNHHDGLTLNSGVPTWSQRTPLQYLVPSSSHIQNNGNIVPTQFQIPLHPFASYLQPNSSIPQMQLPSHSQIQVLPYFNSGVNFLVLPPTQSSHRFTSNNM